MVILDKFETQILINDVPAEEYTDDQATSAAAANEVVRYIEAQSDETFAIVFKILPVYFFRNCDFLEWAISIDGNPVSRPIVLRRGRSPGLESRHIRRDVRYFDKSANDWKKYAFQFSSLETRDMAPGEDEQDLKARYAGLGEVQITVSRFGDCREIPYGSGKASVPNDIGAVPEKATKGQAVSHSVKLRDDGIAQPGIHYKGAPADEGPIAIFTFKYRSREALKQSLIIPRSPSPVPLEERDPDTLTIEELRSLVRQQKERGAIKSERDVKPLMKRMRSDTVSPTHRPFKMSRTSSGQPCIDLDSDAEEEADSRAWKTPTPPSSVKNTIETLDLT